MAANTILVVEKEFPYPREILFRAFMDADELAAWRGPRGWHVPRETIVTDPRVGGRHQHVKVKDDDPGQRIVTNAIYLEVFEPDVIVAKQRISGAPGLRPDVPLELRVEFTKTGKNWTLVRIVQGPYDAAVAADYSDGWEGELEKLATHLTKTQVAKGAKR